MMRVVRMVRIPRIVATIPPVVVVVVPRVVAHRPVPVVPRVVRIAPPRVVERIYAVAPTEGPRRRINAERYVGSTPRAKHRGNVLRLYPYLIARYHHIVERGVVRRGVEHRAATN